MSNHRQSRCPYPPMEKTMSWKLAAAKFSAESQLVFGAEAGPDLVNGLLEFLRRERLKREPFVLHLLPEYFDPVKFRAIRRQKVKPHAFFLQQFPVGLQWLGRVDRGIVQNQHQRLRDPSDQRHQKTKEPQAIDRVPQLCHQETA